MSLLRVAVAGIGAAGFGSVAAAIVAILAEPTLYAALIHLAFRMRSHGRFCATVIQHTAMER